MLTYIPTRFTAALAVCMLLSAPAWSADSNPKMTDKMTPTTTPSPQAPPQNPDLPDCTRANYDPRCRPPGQDHRPHPYYRRPVIINSEPAAPALDPDTLTDNWDGCRTAKLNAIQARNGGDREQANRLDEWLWKNCRSFSDELRDLEQDRM